MYQEIKFVPYRPFGIFIGCCGIGMLLLGIAALVVPYLMIQSIPQPEEVDVQLMQECTRCRDKESKNWEDAAQKRIVQLEALKKQLDSYKAEADTFRGRAQRCEAGRAPVEEEHPFKVDDVGLHINMEAVTGASFDGAIFEDVTTDWGVCSGVGPWCIAKYEKLSREGRKVYDAMVKQNARKLHDEIAETLKVKDGTH